MPPFPHISVTCLHLSPYDNYLETWGFVDVCFDDLELETRWVEMHVFFFSFFNGLLALADC